MEKCACLLFSKGSESERLRPWRSRPSFLRLQRLTLSAEIGGAPRRGGSGPRSPGKSSRRPRSGRPELSVALLAAPARRGAPRALLAGLADPRDVARLLSASTPESAALFQGLPCSRDGTALTDVELPVVVGLRLGLPVAAPGVCECREPLDSLGDHALSCNRGSERLRRHDEFNSRVRDLLGEAGCPAVLEPAGLAAPDARRFDGVTVAAFEEGGRWRGTRQSFTPAPRVICLPRPSPRAAAAEAESHKARKYADLGDRYDFRPIGVETLGAFGPRALELVEALVARFRGKPTRTASARASIRRLGAAVQAGNARRIIEAHSAVTSDRPRAVLSHSDAASVPLRPNPAGAFSAVVVDRHAPTAMARANRYRRQPRSPR